MESFLNMFQLYTTSTLFLHYSSIYSMGTSADVTISVSTVTAKRDRLATRHLSEASAVISNRIFTTFHFQYNLTRQFWLDSGFLVKFESSCLVLFDSYYRYDSTFTAHIQLTISDLNQLFSFNYTHHLCFNSIQFPVMIWLAL